MLDMILIALAVLAAQQQEPVTIVVWSKYSLVDSRRFALVVFEQTAQGLLPGDALQRELGRHCRRKALCFLHGSPRKAVCCAAKVLKKNDPQ